MLFSRDVATITMDLNGVEKIGFSALGGADKVTSGLTIDGGNGDDFLSGSILATTTLNGGNGNDVLIGGFGNDLLMAVPGSMS